MTVVLKRRASRRFHINICDPRHSICERSLFLIFINDAPDVIRSQPGMYLMTTIYFCLNSKYMSDNVKLAAALVEMTSK